MAELTRVRGADTEEKLLELQRAFLASSDHRAVAAARVTRVGGAPAQAPTPDEAAGVLPQAMREAAGAGAGGGDAARGGGAGGGGQQQPADGDGEAAEETAEAMDGGSWNLGEVVERSAGGSGVAPSPPSRADPALAFPAATHRSAGPFAGRKSKFMVGAYTRPLFSST